MACEFFRSDDGKVVGVMCSRGPKKRCVYCGKPMTKLCDYPLEDGKTCDVPMCSACATHIGDDLDVCRKHSDGHAVEKTLRGGEWRETL